MAQEIKVVRGSKLLVAAAVCIVVAALYLAREVLIPLALSFLFTFLLTPLVARLERWKLPRIVAVLLVVGVTVGFVLGIGYVVQRQFVATAEELPRYTGRIKEKIANLSGMGGGLFKAAGTLEKTMSEFAPGTTPTTNPATRPTTAPAAAVMTSGLDRADVGVRSAANLILPTPQAPGTAPASPDLSQVTPENPLPVREYSKPLSPVAMVGGYVGTIVSPLATAGVVLVFVVFMLLAREDMRDRAIRLLGGGQEYVTTTTEAFDDATKRVSRYLTMQLLINASYGVVITFGLWVTGLISHEGVFPNVLLWGLLCALFRFIPYVGPFISSLFPLALSFAAFEQTWVFFAVGGLILSVELLTGNYIEPRLYGSSTGMSEVAILVSAVFWTWLWGPVGLLMSTPLTVCLVVLGRYVPQLQFLNVLLGDEPVLDPPTRTYQRLLARDEDEAEELCIKMLREHGLEHTYDELLLPVLSLAESDTRRGALDRDRQDFIRRAVRNLVTDLAELSKTDELRKSANAVVAAAKGQETAASNGAADAVPVASLGEPAGPTVICLPAADEEDALAALMLAEMLNRRGYRATVVSHEALSSERAEAANGADIAVISALPPSAVPHSRLMLKRIRGGSPDMPLVIGLWRRVGDLAQAEGRLDVSGPVRVATTLALAVEQVRQFRPYDARTVVDTAPATTGERI